ncbi:TfoX/Sxy family protein [Arenibaculum pallidiluteum]|uniref:TfoX/Sxy family protein n=1 Tax=Arenibaculum pallidiluteum TaxID=2812559 RepID=UPI001A96E894|nr:TfoX/Sxy family protein [Arenibaculum pallidiluteum]
MLAPLGDVTARRMFGGWGLRCGGLFFAIVSDDVLYLKADDVTRARFEAEGLEPFRPMADRPALPYYPPPDDALEDPEALLPWARLAVEAARRTRDAAAPRKPRSPRGAQASRMSRRN